MNYQGTSGLSAKLISLSELGYLLAFGGIAVIKQNSYAGTFAGMIIAKQVPEKLIKYLGDQHIKRCNLRYNSYGNYVHNCHHGSKKFFLDLVRRPDHAHDCNMINKGGDVSIKKSGLPSGHATVAAFVFVTVLLELLRRKKNNIKIPITLFAYSCVVALLIPIARYELKCHTDKQILIGLMWGTILAFIFDVIDSKYLSKYSRYVNDKKKFYDMFTI